eukprot:5559998-Amphidinium_carterae.1
MKAVSGALESAKSAANLASDKAVSGALVSAKSAANLASDSANGVKNAAGAATDISLKAVRDAMTTGMSAGWGEESLVALQTLSEVFGDTYA